MKRYRNEWKYQCAEPVLASVMERMRAILTPDEHGVDGAYTIRSLYFDNIYNICARETEAGLSDRFKYRIRYYGDDPGTLRLEKKEKREGRCHKDSCALTRDEYELIMSGDYSEVLWNTDNPVLKEFCIRAISQALLPKAIIEYDRTAYIEPVNNIRVTADRNISASYQTERFLEGDYTRIPILPKGQHVLEVKFDHILPGYIRKAVTARELIQESFSKYYIARKNLFTLERTI